MTIWAIVPVKPLRRGKSRLASVLTEDERAELNREMLTHTVQTLVKVPALEHVLVISRDPKALSVAREYGARTVRESGTPHLNVALTRATAVAATYAARSILILPADLPNLSGADVEAMIAKASAAPVVVIAPDSRGEGTNGMLINPVGLIEYDFGVGSFARHVAQAERKGAQVQICELSNLAHDIDLPEDLIHLDRSPETWLANGVSSPNGYSATPPAE